MLAGIRPVLVPSRMEDPPQKVGFADQIDLLYGDHEGGQRTISRFALIPAGEDQWLASASRHWNLDRANPR